MVGFQFTPTVTGAVTSIDLAITNALGNGNGPNTFNVQLNENSPANEIGTLLGSYDGVTTGTSNDDDYYSRVLTTGVSLTAGTDYWIVVRMADNEIWNSTDGDTSQYGYRHNSQVPQDTRYMNQASAAFSVSVAPQAVPEPASIAALGVGAAGLLRRRRKG